MEGASMQISLDKLPIKRLEHIEENGVERFPPDVGYDERRLSLIRRIDFAWAVEKDENKKQKKEKSSSSTPQWPWQSLVENLQLAHQELSVIIDLINTVEANDQVTVASMSWPKPLPNEALSDLATSAATKLQCFRNLGKYFKKSAKAFEQQIGREARFYGALIRLQQNWKVKRQRFVASAPSSEGFSIDLYDNASYDPAAVFRPSLCTVPIERDSAGMLAVSLPPNSCRFLHFGFAGSDVDSNSHFSLKPPLKKRKKESVNDDEFVKETHSALREVHQAIFNELVFELVNRGAFNRALGVNVTGIQENHLQLSVGQGASVFLSLMSSKEDDHTDEVATDKNFESENSPMDTLEEAEVMEVKNSTLDKKSLFPNCISFEIYLQQLFHKHAFVKTKERTVSTGKTQMAGQVAKDGSGLLGHFCISLAHRIFSNKVLMELENLVSRVPYLQMISHTTWHSRTSSWTLSMNVPRSVFHSGHLTRTSENHQLKNVIKTNFRTKVMINDDCIRVEGEGAPNVVGLFRGSSEDVSGMNKYECDWVDLPMILLQQVASQVILWLHEEALAVGIKANRDFLCLSFELEHGETLGLVAHVDPEDDEGCISWWLVMEEDRFASQHKTRTDVSNGESEYKKFLGHLSLEVLYSTLMDLVSLRNGGGVIECA